MLFVCLWTSFVIVLGNIVVSLEMVLVVLCFRLCMISDSVLMNMLSLLMMYGFMFLNGWFEILRFVRFGVMYGS